MSRRLERLNEQLRREIATVLRERVRDPRVGVVTVTGVEVAADLAVAKVYVRVLEVGGRREEMMEGLDAAAPFVRRLLGEVLTLRRVPELRFREDRSMEHARRIESVLREVRPASEDEDGPGADPGQDSPDPAGGTADSG